MLLDCGTWSGDMLLCSYYPGICRAGFYCSYFAPDTDIIIYMSPDIVKF